MKLRRTERSLASAAVTTVAEWSELISQKLIDEADPETLSGLLSEIGQLSESEAGDLLAVERGANIQQSKNNG